MNDEKRKILEMVGEGKISQDDALRLLDALEDDRVDRAFDEAMAHLREEQAEAGPQEPPPQPEPPEPVEAQVIPPRPEESIWGEMGEAAREVGQVLSQTASVTMDVIAEGMQWAKGAVEKIPGVSVWWEDQPETDGREQPLPYHYPDGPAEVRKLDIQWVNGPIEIVPWDGEWVNVTEYSKYPLEEGRQLELTVTDGGAMRIRWTREKSFWKGLRLSKYLLIQVPAGLELEKVEVENVSGSIHAESLACEKISLSTTSGQVEAAGLRAEKLKLASVSGRLYMENVQAEHMTLHTTSGRIEAPGFGAGHAKFSSTSGSIKAYGNSETLRAETVSGSILIQTETPPERVRLESCSGRVTLILPPNNGFTAHYDTMSGKFITSFPVSGDFVHKSGKVVYGDGGMEVSLHTLSGKMEIRGEP